MAKHSHAHEHHAHDHDSSIPMAKHAHAHEHHAHDHDHDHDDHAGHTHEHHNHDHDHGPQPQSTGRLWLAFALTTLVMVFEAGGGWWSGSLALLTDAAHMLVDSVALLIALAGAWYATRPPDQQRTYGYGRMEVLAGFVNALIQLALIAFIVVEAVLRLRSPEHIQTGIMFWVAVIGLIANLAVLRTLGGHDHAHDDVNSAAAVLHVMGDLLGSAAAIIAALLIRWLGWGWADPLLSIVVALLVLNSALRLLRRSAHILLEGVPEGIDLPQLTEALRGAHPAIVDLHHLHTWQLASGSRMATLHVVVADSNDGSHVVHALTELAEKRFGIGHLTVQVEPGQCEAHPHCGLDARLG